MQGVTTILEEHTASIFFIFKLKMKHAASFFTFFPQKWRQNVFVGNYQQSFAVL